jgi:hypothetical protein
MFTVPDTFGPVIAGPDGLADVFAGASCVGAGCDAQPASVIDSAVPPTICQSFIDRSPFYYSLVDKLK